jgi:hypothetical protein
MGIFDRAREDSDEERDDSARVGSANESREAAKQSGQVSESGSSFDNNESATGGADAVPDTPDVVEEDYT